MRSSKRTPVACGVDIGSTNVKIVLLTPDGGVIARHGRPTPRDVRGLCIEGPALVAVIEAMIAAACADRHEVQAVCVAGVGEDGVLVDDDLRPLTPALAWFDPRRHSVLRELRADVSPDDTFDVDDDAGRTMVGWAWARRRAGAEGAFSWIAVTDLPAAQWSLRPFLSDTLASRTGAWRASDRSWSSDRVVSALGALELLPPVLRAGDVVGALDAPPLRATGAIARDAIVVAGGHDHPIGGWGVDRMTPGAVLDSMGTAEVVVAQSALPPTVRHGGVDVAPGIRSSGSTRLRVEELARNVAWASQDPAVGAGIRALLDGTAAPEPVLESGYFLPGARGGGRPCYALDAPRDPRARAAAVLGALACGGRDAVRAVCGGEVERSAVRLAGGWARSPGWVAIKEAVNGYHAEPIAEPEVTAVGAALLAAAACGWNADPARALRG